MAAQILNGFCRTSRTLPGRADQFGGSGQATAPGDPARDMLWSLIDWVEKGRAPVRIEAAKVADDKLSFTRPLCAFPRSARYDGKGDPESAASFVCVAEPDYLAQLTPKVTRPIQGR